MANEVQVKVPDIGDFKDVAIIELLVKPGEVIAVDTGLIMVESDKASMEIPSSHAGTVKDVRVKLGDKVSEGSVILTVEAAGGATLAAGAAAGALATPGGEGCADVEGAAVLAGGDAAAPLSSVSNAVPWDTLSPTFTVTALTTPADGDGTSIVALSDSSVTSESSALTVSPGFTSTSMTGTSLKSPMSGTFTSTMAIARFPRA